MTNTIWIARCPKCGPVRIEQTSQPSTCKQQAQYGKRSWRQCREYLTDIRATRGKTA